MLTQACEGRDAYSASMCLGGSREDCREIGAGESSIISSSAGVEMGVGDVTSIEVHEGIL
jgi:hypothetical protein